LLCESWGHPQSGTHALSDTFKHSLKTELFDNYQVEGGMIRVWVASETV